MSAPFESESPESSPAAEVPRRAGQDVVPPSGDPGRACEVELPQFEGPLDLLLHLVRRHELDILDIPIAFVCEKYLEYLEFMRALDLEVAGDYLVMAATLAYLKSRELVPQDPTQEDPTLALAGEGPDPRAELIARLLEYQTFRAAAAQLDRLPIAGRDVFDRGGAVDLPPLDSGLAPITLYRLAEAYQRVLERARVLKSHEVVLERVSVASRMQQLTLTLIERSRFDFEQLFLEREWASEQELRAMLIVTLMSVLELVRLGVARVHQPEGSEALLVERAATAEEARQALSGYDERRSFGPIDGGPVPGARPDPLPVVEHDVTGGEDVASGDEVAGGDDVAGGDSVAGGDQVADDATNDEAANDEAANDEAASDEAASDEAASDEAASDDAANDDGLLNGDGEGDGRDG